MLTAKIATSAKENAKNGIRGLDENALSRIIIGSAIEVHRELGPGLLESAYEDRVVVGLNNRILKDGIHRLALGL